MQNLNAENPQNLHFYKRLLFEQEESQNHLTRSAFPQNFLSRYISITH